MHDLEDAIIARVTESKNNALAKRGILQLSIGLLLIALFWFASWAHLGIVGEYSFFPIWLGYILTVDGLVGLRGRASILARDTGSFAALFVLSAPVWWLFEGLNQFVLNWHYLGGENYSAFQFILIATLDFATVIPAIAETSELISTFGSIKRLRVTDRRIPFVVNRQWLLMFGGAAMLLGIILLPRYFFPAMWLWGVLIIDPLNWLRGRPSLFAQVSVGNWEHTIALALGGLVCGLFWEMWNFYAFPKWYYTVPFFDLYKVFEMPALGYLGYIPFAWELYGLYHFFTGILGVKPVVFHDFMSSSHRT